MPPVVTINVAITRSAYSVAFPGQFITSCTSAYLVPTPMYFTEQIDCIVGPNGAGISNGLSVTSPALTGFAASYSSVYNLNFQPPTIAALLSNEGPVSGGQVSFYYSVMRYLKTCLGSARPGFYYFNCFHFFCGV
jgi:hypothetical protein